MMSLLHTKINNRPEMPVSAGNGTCNTSVLTFSELCYLLFFGMMLTAKGLGLSEGALVYDLLLAGGMFFFLLKMVFTRYDRLELLIVFLLLALTAVVYLRTGERGIVFCSAMALGLKDVSLKRIFRVGAALLTACFFMMMALTQAGIIEDLWYVHDKGALGFAVRWSFGYTHPNVLHITWLLLTALWLYLLPLRTKRQLWGTCGLFMLGNLYILFYSLSYTGFLVCTFYLACNLVFLSRTMHDAGKCQDRKAAGNTENENTGNTENTLAKAAGRLVDVLALLLFPVCVLFSVAGPVLFKGRLYELADKLVHHRFVLSNYFLTTEPISLLGHRLLTTPDATRSIDCSYTYLFVHLGVFFFVLLCIGYQTLIMNALRRGRYRELSILLSFSLAGVSEPFLFNTSFKNITMLFLGCWLYHCLEKWSERLPAFWQKDTVFCLLTDKADQRLTFPLPDFLQQTKNAKAADSRTVKAAANPEDTGKTKETAQTYLSKLPLWQLCCLAAILGIVCYLFLAPRPQAVLIAPAYCTDGFETEPRIYSAQELTALKEEDHARILSFEETDQPLALFTGKTPKLEYARSAVSCGLWCALAAAADRSLYALRKKKKQR